MSLKHLLGRMLDRADQMQREEETKAIPVYYRLPMARSVQFELHEILDRRASHDWLIFLEGEDRTKPRRVSPWASLERQYIKWYKLYGCNLPHTGIRVVGIRNDSIASRAPTYDWSFTRVNEDEDKENKQ